MALSLSTFSNGATIDAAGSDSPLSRINSVENFVNWGIDKGDMTSDWVGRKLLYKPEFWTSADTGSRLPTIETHWRSVPMDRGRRSFYHPDKVVYNPSATSADPTHNGGWMWIPNMCATVHVERTCRIHVSGRLYTYESGGSNDIVDYTGTAPTYTGTAETAATISHNVACFVNEAIETGTTREVYKTDNNSTNGSARNLVFPRKELNWDLQLGGSFAPGVYNIGFRIRLKITNHTDANPKSKHIYIDGRSFTLEKWLR